MLTNISAEVLLLLNATTMSSTGVMGSAKLRCWYYSYFGVSYLDLAVDFEIQVFVLLFGFQGPFNDAYYLQLCCPLSLCSWSFTRLDSKEISVKGLYAHLCKEHKEVIMILKNQQSSFSYHLLVVTSSKQQIMLGESNSSSILEVYLRLTN